MSPAQKTFFVFLLALFIPLYLLRLHQVPEYKIPEDVSVKIVGRVSQQPYLKVSNQIINVGPVLIKTSRFPGYFYGQKLEIVGRFEKRVLNPFQTQFLAYYPTIRLVEEKEDLSKMTVFWRILFKIRGRLEGVVNQLLSEPQSSLLNGILLGAKKEMPQEFWQNLRDTGTLHIIVASGYNISVVAGCFIYAFTWLMNRKKALIFALGGVVLYTLMIGAEPPVVRAAIMVSLAFTAQTLGRQEDGLVALIFAAVAMLLLSPLIFFDIGFQLSFAATAGMVVLEPILKEKRRIFTFPVLGEGLATTLAAQLGVMPIILLNFGQISFLSPLINALILPVVPLIMNLGAIVVFVGLLIRPLGQVLAWFVWVLLTYFVTVINISSRLPWVSFKLGKLSVWWGILYYFALGCLIWRKRKRHLGRAPRMVAG